MIKLLLKEVRIQKTITIRDLADKSGVAKSHIEKIEKNKTKPSLEVMVKLAQALGVNIEKLYRIED